MSRFGILDEESVHELKEPSENEKTKKTHNTGKNVFVKWATEKKKIRKILKHLDKTLSQFYAEVPEAQFTRSHAISLEATLKLKIIPEIY